MAIKLKYDSFADVNCGAAIPSAVDSVGQVIYPDIWPQTLTYSGGNLSTISITDGVNTWVQTYTYSGGLLASISQWVKQ